MQTVNSKEPAAVVKDLQSRTFNDAFARNGKLRADNLMVHDMYLAEVKKPNKVTEPFDVFKILATVEGKDVFSPLSTSACPMVTAQK